MKSLALAVLVVVSFGITQQTANASVEICREPGSNNRCTNTVIDCPAGFPWKGQSGYGVFNVGDWGTKITCESDLEWCATNSDITPDLCYLVNPNSPSTTSPYKTSETTSTTSSSTTVPSSGGSSSSTKTTTAPSIVVARTTTTTTQIDAVEDDGDSEEDFADLGISNKSGKFDMRISSSFVETEMILRAYKKGSKSVTWSFTTNADGKYRIITSRSLKGFTMSLWIDGEKWDSLVVR